MALPPSDRGHRVRVPVPPDLGRLEFADTVHVAALGDLTAGLLVAHDAARTLWLLTLSLTPAEGADSWRATVGRVVSAGVTHSFPDDRPTPAFTFRARGSGVTRTIEDLEYAPGGPSPLRLVPALDA